MTTKPRAMTTKPPDKVLVMLDAGYERRYYFSVGQAADGLIGYYPPGRGAGVLVYRLDEDASGALDALTDKEVTAIRAMPQTNPMSIPMAKRKAFYAKERKTLKDALAKKIAAIVPGL